MVAILGASISVGNRGVKALGTSLVNLCARMMPHADIWLMIGHRRREKAQLRVAGKLRDVEIINCRLSPRAKLREHLGWIIFASILYRLIPWKHLRAALSRFTPWISSLERASLVGDIRGGDSFSDLYGMRRFLEGFFIAWTAVLVKGSIVQFPQTFGPYRSVLSRVTARYLLNRSWVVMARDMESQRLVERLVPGKEVVLCPDVAFSLEALKPEHIQVEPQYDSEGELPSKLIGINVNGLMYNGGYTRNNMFGLRMDYRELLPRLVEVLLADFQGEVWLVPHTYGPPGNVESDPDACRQVYMALGEDSRGRVRVVTGNYDCHELKWLIGQCDFFIGSRMHSCIAALSQGVPCIGIAYSRKFQGVFETVGMEDWVIDARKVENEEAINRIIELYKKRSSIRHILKLKSEESKRKLEETFQKLISQFE